MTENRDMLQVILDAPNIGIGIFTAIRNPENEIVNFRCAFVNKRTFVIFNGNDPTGMLVTDFGSDGMEQLRHLKETIEEDKKVSYVRQTRLGVAEGWFQFSNAPLDGNHVVQTWEDITEQKKSEREIHRLKDEIAKKATDKYHSIFNSINEGFCIQELIYNNDGKPTDFRIIEANPAYEKQTGLKREAVIGRLNSELLLTTESYWFEHYDRIAKSGQSENFETWHEPTARWYNVSISRIGDKNSRLLSVVFNNITERKHQEQQQKHVEQTLWESKNRFESIANLVPDLLWDSEPCGSTNWYNQRWLEYTGQSFEQAIGWGWIDAIHPDDREGSAKRYREAVEASKPLRQEHRIRRHDGQYRWFMVNASPLKDQDGRVIKMYGAATDIHDSKQAAEALRTSEEKYRSIFETIDEGFTIQELITDENDNVIDIIYREANAAFERNTGITNVIGKKASEFLPELEQHWLDSMAQVRNTGEPLRTEGYQSDLDRWITLHYSRIGGPGSKFLSVVFQDITEQKRREMNLAFLAEIDREFAYLSKADEIMKAVGAKIGNYLQITTCSFTDVQESEDRVTVDYGWSDASVLSTEDTFRLSRYLNEEFMQASREGKTVVINDTQNDSRTAAAAYAELNIYSFVTVPFHNHNKWTHYIAICDSKKRNWRPDEIELIEEVCQRIFPRLERARAEEALQRRERELVRVQEIGNVGGVDIDVKDHLKARRSPEYLRLHGLPADMLFETHKDWLRRLHPDDREQAEMTLFYALHRTQLNYESEYRIIRPDNGEVRWIYAKMDIERDTDGKPLRLIGAHIDITRRKLAEEELKLSEERLRTALGAADMAAWDWDINNDTIVWNEQHYYVLGLIPDGKLQKAYNFLKFVHPDDTEIVNVALTKAINEIGLYRAEFRIIREDKKICWMSGYGRAVRFDAEGKATRMVGVMYDISEMKQKEKLKDEFIAVASHELKTPVTSIKAYAEIIQERLESLGSTEDSLLLAKLDVQIDRLTALINHLLDTTQMSEGRLQLQVDAVDINTLLNEKVQEIKRTTDHLFELDLKALPNIHADGSRLGQVITNLLSNAVKYAAATSTIKIRSWKETDNIRVTVEDYGIGIPQADIENIFNKFFRVTSNKRDTFSGMGLGLYVSEQIIHAHHGTIWAESVEGKGSVFSFSLPINED